MTDLDQTLLRSIVAGRTELPPAETPSRLRSEARRNGASGLVTLAVRRGEIALPPEIEAAILQDWEHARRRSAMLDLELERIGGAASSAQGLCTPIVLKGPAVASRYSIPEARPYVDLDLLVPPAELPGWSALLARLGYRGPGAWRERESQRFAHHVQYLRPVADGHILCEMHARVFMERRARRVDYGVLRSFTEPSGFPGVSRLAIDAQLLVLALHFSHHAAGERRLVWLRDFIELGNAEAVAGARRLAVSLGVDWALEKALAATEDVLGEPRWNARPADEPARFGLATVQDRGEGGDLYYLALMRELGFWGGVRYLASRFDPRRFARTEGGLDAAEVRSWIGRRARGVKAAFSGRGARGGGRRG